MAVWEYKVISSGKGGFATPALLESFLNQLGTDEWEIVEFRGQPDNPLAFSGLARRPTQRDWTLEDAAAAAARAEADKLRAGVRGQVQERHGRRRPRRRPRRPSKEAGREDDGLRRLRDTERDCGSRRPGHPRGRVGQARRRGRAADLLRGHAAPPSQEPARTGLLGRRRLPCQEMGHLRGRGDRRAQGVRPGDPRGRGREGHLRRVRRRPLLGEHQPARGALGQHEGEEPPGFQDGPGHPCRARGGRRRPPRPAAKRRKSESTRHERQGGREGLRRRPPRRFPRARRSSTGSVRSCARTAASRAARAA